jgi:hypothetical protein
LGEEGAMGPKSVLLAAVFVWGCSDSLSQPPQDATPQADAGVADAPPGADAAPDAEAWHTLLPFSREEMLDQSTLQEETNEYTEPSACFRGRTNRVVHAQYFSHSWHDGDWKGELKIVIPETIERPGVLALADSAPDLAHTEAGMDPEQEYLDCTANQFGIVAASLPNSDEHFGVREIHDVFDHMLCEMAQRNDLAWSPFWPLVALRMRAITAVGKVTGQPVHSAYHFGASITGSLSHPLARYDARIKALAVTGAYGGRGMDRSAIHYKSGLYDRWCEAGCNPYAIDPALSAALTETADIYALGPWLTIPILEIVPTNDSNAPPLLTPELFAPLAGQTHHAMVPNVVHTHGTLRHARLFRMWIDHVELGRPVNRIEDFRFESRDARVVASARVSEDAPLQGVSLYYVAFDDDTYLGSPDWWNTPAECFTSAQWQEAPMQRAGDRWEVAIPAPAARYVAGFVDAIDSHQNTPGYVSSFIKLLPLRTQAEAELCQAIAADCRGGDDAGCARFAERCLEGCVDSFARCVLGLARGSCDEAKAAMCDDALQNCLDQPCRDAYAQCAASGFTSCDAFFGTCLEPCEEALFRWMQDPGSTSARDQVLQCGLNS